MACHCVYRDGFVSLQEYMAFMISRETENVQSAREVEAAFRALTTGDKPYITANELFAVSIVVLCHSMISYEPMDRISEALVDDVVEVTDELIWF